MNNKEKRTERLNIVLTPSTMQDFKTLSVMQNESMNNLVHRLIDEEIEKNAEKIEQYREFMKKMIK